MADPAAEVLALMAALTTICLSREAVAILMDVNWENLTADSFIEYEDEDVDNDGKKNTKTDKYLKKRRVKIGQAIASHKK